MAQAVRPMLEARGFDFQVEVAAARAPCDVDADAFASVLGNLVDNASKFAGDRREILLRAFPSRAGFRVEVLDRGPGVPPAERERIFRRFYRGAGAARGALPGIGLGLHVARETMRAHGGSIHVEEREGGGAAFILELPEHAA
jgi:signal transduction histidine kinase